LALLEQLKKFANACSYVPSRKDLYDATTRQLGELEKKLSKILKELKGKSEEAWNKFGELINVDPGQKVELVELRRLMRVGPDGQRLPQIVIALTQEKKLQIEGAAGPQFFYGGATLIVDLATSKIQYSIGKRINSKSEIKGETREQRTMKFLQSVAGDPLQQLLLAPKGEPFAVMHSLGDIVS
jgi:hypothetical protein